MGFDIYHLRAVTPVAGMRVDYGQHHTFLFTELGPRAAVRLRFWQRAAPVFFREILTELYVCDSDADACSIQELFSTQTGEHNENPPHALVRVTDGRHIDEQLVDVGQLIVHPVLGMSRYKKTLTLSDGTQIRCWIAEYWGDLLRVCLLGEVIGRQRAGMSAKVRSVFENERAHAERAEFEELLDCVDMDSEDADRTTASLQATFLDQFVPGETFFVPSW